MRREANGLAALGFAVSAPAYLHHRQLC
jgi:hypothetical protein